MSQDTKKTNRRSHIRYGIKLDAVLMIDDSSAVECVIHDFCFGGLLLVLKQPKTVIPSLQDKKIKVHFSVSREYGGEEFQIDAKVKRVNSDSIGVAFENISASAFNALEKEAYLQLGVISSDRRSISPNKSNQKKFLTALGKMLEEHLPPLPAKFFERVDRDLSEALENAKIFKDKTARDDLLTKLKFDREAIVGKFCSSIIVESNRISGTKPKEKAASVIDAKTLSLVDKNDFEDWLNISSIIRKLASRYEHNNNQLEQKLSIVLGLPRNAVNNPISPANLCESFREAIQEIDKNNTVRNTLYKIFERILIDCATDLYDQFDKLLVDYGAPERCEPDAPRQAPITAKDQTHANHQISDKEQNIRQKQRQPLIANDKALALLQPSEPATGAGRKHPIAQTALKLLNILKESAGISPVAVNEYLPGKEQIDSADGSHLEFSPDEIVATISQLQANKTGNNASERDSHALQTQLIDTFETIGNGQKKLSAADKNNLVVYGKFFETLFNDLIFSSDIKSYVESIRLPLMALAFQGYDLLESNAHPARNIINQLAFLEPALKGNRIINNSKVKPAVEKLVTRIAQEYVTNPDIFAIVDQKLNEITEKVNKSMELNIRRVIEVCEGNQQLEKARRFVQDEIDKRIAGKSIPKIITSFLTLGWQDLLVIAELGKEKSGNKERQCYFKVIDDLIAWLSSRKPFSDEDIRNIHNVLDFIDNQPCFGCANPFLKSKLIDELTASLLGTGNPRSRKAVEMVDIEPASLKKDAPLDIIPDKWTEQVAQLQVGEWLAILFGEDEYEHLKLVWIGDAPPVYVFVNREGLKKLELNKEKLAELMQTGAANKIESLDAPLMDRATNMMLQQMHEKLIYNASHDPTTDLLNRKGFVKQLKQEILKLNGSRHMLCYMEIQDFGIITNDCGLSGGDDLLKKLSNLMKNQLRNEEVFARLGDKTFGILFKRCSSDEGHAIAKKLQTLINDWHFEWKDKSYSIDVSMGLTPLRENDYDVDELFNKADIANASAKRSGRNGIWVYKNEDEHLKLQNELYAWAGRIDHVLSQNRLFIRCQMIAPIDAEKNDHIHYEILLGIIDETGNIIPPDNFIPAAERFQRMPEIDRWIIKRVFSWIAQNKRQSDKIGGFSINLSGQSLNNEAFLEFLKNLLTSSNIQPEKLIFEITETVAAKNFLFTKKFINQIKRFGCKFSLDDFGSGYSSYSYLKSMNVDYLKIDGAFVKDICRNNTDIAIVKSMNEIAHSLGLETIAEYVESNDILDILKDIGVDYAQGWRIQKPVLLEELGTKP
jgi:diguanylate cyclase (GGDEF)-like protein